MTCILGDQCNCTYNHSGCTLKPEPCKIECVGTICLNMLTVPANTIELKILSTPMSKEAS